MAYKKLKPHLIPVAVREIEMRKIWKDEYCNMPIETFDGVLVRFYEDMFDHCFFESANRKAKDKSILSLNRLEKMLWIKSVLKDKNAVLKKGWDNVEKTYFKDRRVAIVKDNYVVIIRFTGILKAKLVTAYEKNDIANILGCPDFERSEEFFGNI
ncbi:MAG: hypothetical protein JJE44_14110 [Flavobacteriaceae bacterium]|nr:hypothetical protein [Flavobacteriaceae bacterium]